MKRTIHWFETLDDNESASERKYESCKFRHGVSSGGGSLAEARAGLTKRARMRLVELRPQPPPSSRHT